jgi:hypothetical protein
VHIYSTTKKRTVNTKKLAGDTDENYPLMKETIDRHWD